MFMWENKNVRWILLVWTVWVLNVLILVSEQLLTQTMKLSNWDVMEGTLNNFD